MSKRNSMNTLANLALRMMAAQFNLRPSLRAYLKSTDGWTNFTIGLTTETGTVEQAIVFHDGRVKVIKTIPDNADAVMRFINDEVLKEIVKITPNEMLNLALKNKIILEGNMAYLQAFNFFISLIMGKKHQKMLDKIRREEMKTRKEEYGTENTGLSQEIKSRSEYRMKATAENDLGVRYLDDPYLSEYSIDDFPRIKRRLDELLSTKPEISSERPRLLTRWYRKNGFEVDKEGTPWFPELRQAHAYKYVMESKKPVIRPESPIAGTCAPEDVAVMIYPDTTGTMIWGELGSIDKRFLNPCTISKKTVEELHDIYPFWAKRITREWIRSKFDYPLCQKIDERAVASFNFKTVSMSHVIPDLFTIINEGTHSIIERIRRQIDTLQESETDQLNTLQSMIICLEGLNIYAENLAGEALRLAEIEEDPNRIEELKKLHHICIQVPAHPARDIDEAINAFWIFWVGLVMENNNVSLSPGRLDQVFQPFFEKGMEKLSSSAEKQVFTEHVIELFCFYFIRNAEHQNLVPDVANYLFSGSHAETAITVGGVTPDGKDAVNDMTYILLKVTEMLRMRDPNMNARFKVGVNSDTYLKRLCEVNFITVATPSMHGDDAVMEALSQSADKIEDIRDWAATGCVEITIPGKQGNHAGATSINMVAGLEMALNNGYHPLMNWHLGPETGKIENDDFTSFDAFYDAFAAQTKFIIDQTIMFNNMAAEAYAYLRPTPYLSAAIQGTIEKGKDVTHGGAIYNTSGTFNIGLSDVVDSMMVIKKLVFEEKKITMKDLKRAVDSNFENDAALHTMVMNKVPRFGSGSDEAVDMANRVAHLIHTCYKSTKNFRGGDYTVGFWSVAQHSAYGALSGAIPSGRLAYSPFTPGLTPHPSASMNFLDNIRDVAKMNPHYMDNNIAFNVRLVPAEQDSHEKTVDTMFSYVKTYFEQGGMQMQFNIVKSAVLKDAMVNPEHYKNLLVRISGYNAYFIHLSRDMQLEIINRAEFGI
ncbi:pyruvate formate lyase family protein [Desulfoluna sp.]|uniref:pyruvate formate lyase family protein n=1 Tax=Desulfoluna sp. TaxID=2045199 RepID=UPI0026303E24|nr:pyruvate formate lyase family protein [Desulfoluna sp.]